MYPTLHVASFLFLVAVLVAWPLSYAPWLRTRPVAQLFRKNVFPPLVFISLGFLIIIAGMIREQSGVPGRFRGGGPVFGIQDIIVGIIVTSCGFILAFQRWYSARK